MNWAYVAGFLDGEGSIVKSPDKREFYRIQVTQAHESVLYQIKKFTGVGNVSKLTKRKPHWSDSWVYQISNRRDVLFFLKNTRPNLIVKRNLADKYIPILEREVRRVEQKEKDLQERIKKCKFLRKRGLSYRAIGKELNVDHGYTRRLILFK